MKPYEYGIADIILLTLLPLCAIAFGIILHISKRKADGEAELKKATYDERTQTLTLYYANGETMEYHGSSTVWFMLPSMHRCCTSVEIELARIYRYIKRYGNSHPDSHKNKLNHPVW